MIKNNDRKTAWIEHATAFKQVMIERWANQIELFKQFGDRSAIRQSLSDNCLEMSEQQSVSRRR